MQLNNDIPLLLEWIGSEKKELNIQKEHVHLVVSVPPKVSISKLMGIVKVKIAIKIFKSFPNLKKKPYWGNHFCSRGYCVDTVGLDEEKIRKYVRYQEENERKEEEQRFDFYPLSEAIQIHLLRRWIFNYI